MIRKIENLSLLKNLESFNISHNHLLDCESVELITECLSITNLDLSDNKFDYSEELFK
jgi:Leucine-rich repeat (LRR) protein